jgi:serine/threonine protein kinase
MGGLRISGRIARKPLAIYARWDGLAVKMNSFSEAGREEPVSETVVCKRCRGAAIADACPDCGRPGNATPTADGIAPVRSRHPGETPRGAISTEVLAAATKLRPSRTAMKPVLPVQLASRFEVLGVLGRGGAGYVLHARDRMIGREVAIKLLAEGFMDPTAVLQSEATHLAGLEHDRIVRLYEFGRAGDAPYLVMELVRGQTLWSLLTRERPPILEALAIGADVAAGLQAAHKHGIVHRDIKPQNIFLDQEGRAKIADFGVARTAEADEKTGDEDQSDAGITGTPGYLAPEQASGRAATPATDVYALGVVLHEILAGERLFTGHSILSILAAQKRGPERKPSAANPGVPAGVDELVMRCLAGDPSDRPSAGEVAEELRAWRERLARALRASPSTRTSCWTTSTSPTARSTSAATPRSPSSPRCSTRHRCASSWCSARAASGSRRSCAPASCARSMPRRTPRA